MKQLEFLDEESIIQEHVVCRAKYINGKLCLDKNIVDGEEILEIFEDIPINIDFEHEALSDFNYLIDEKDPVSSLKPFNINLLRLKRVADGKKGLADVRLKKFEADIFVKFAEEYISKRKLQKEVKITNTGNEFIIISRCGMISKFYGPDWKKMMNDYIKHNVKYAKEELSVIGKKIKFEYIHHMEEDIGPIFMDVCLGYPTRNMIATHRK